MTARPVHPDTLARCKEIIEKHKGNFVAAAAELEIPRNTLASRMQRIGYEYDFNGPPKLQKSALIDPIPEELAGDELVDYLSTRRTRRAQVAEAAALRTVKIKDTKPIGLLFFGDPHLDDDYCNLQLVRKHLAMTHEDGVWGICVGDFTNNWGGRLVRLYGDQGTTKDEATELIRWFLKGGNWLALGVSGNHEKMTSHDAVKIIAAEHGLVYHDWELRMRLTFPKWAGSFPITVNIAHNHTGVSQWVRAFGGVKQATKHDRDDLYICGHHHTSGQVKQAINNHVVTACRVGGYKDFDSHAIMYGHKGDKISPSVLAVLCPDRSPAGRVHVYEDLDLGLRVLRALRSA